MDYTVPQGKLSMGISQILSPHQAPSLKANLHSLWQQPSLDTDVAVKGVTVCGFSLLFSQGGLTLPQVMREHYPPFLSLSAAENGRTLFMSTYSHTISALPAPPVHPDKTLKLVSQLASWQPAPCPLLTYVHRMPNKNGILRHSPIRHLGFLFCAHQHTHMQQAIALRPPFVQVWINGHTFCLCLITSWKWQWIAWIAPALWFEQNMKINNGKLISRQGFGAVLEITSGSWEAPDVRWGEFCKHC